jgi:putative lipoic acid-binding regulatory protein
VSADPISSMSPSKNQLNQKNPKLIKFPIKKQVTVTGYERTSFEQDLEPIIKQVQSTKEIIT